MTRFARGKVLRLGAVGLLLLAGPLTYGMASGAGGCVHTVNNSGSGSTKLNVCVSAEGNVTTFESPAGVGLMNSIYFDGFHLCSDNSLAWDHSEGPGGGPSSGGWAGAANLVSSSPLTISRTVSNNTLTLTQIFSPDAANKALKITMKITNNTGVTQTGVRVGRGWDGGAGGSGPANERGDRTPDSATLFYDFEGRALNLFALTFPTTHSTRILNIGNPTGWIGLIGTTGMCSPLPSLVGPTALGDHFAVVNYDVGSINANATKTVIFSYRRL